MDKESRKYIIRISIIAVMLLITTLVDLTNLFSSEIKTIVSIANIVVDVVVVAFTLLDI